MDTPALPTGTVTFLFTDIEDGGAAAPFGCLASARRAVGTRPRSGQRRGPVPGTRRALVVEPWPEPTPLRVRVGINTGEAELQAGDYYGTAINRCARLRAVAHGGQILLSQGL
jgi:class 3 adenylate cyclase